jgi:hypothetical protein
MRFASGGLPSNVNRSAQCEPICMDYSGTKADEHRNGHRRGGSGAFPRHAALIFAIPTQKINTLKSITFKVNQL